MSYITKISVGTKSLNFAWNIQNFKGRVKKRGEGEGVNWKLRTSSSNRCQREPFLPPFLKSFPHQNMPRERESRIPGDYRKCLLAGFVEQVEVSQKIGHPEVR
jgi:hypothetical protein